MCKHIMQYYIFMEIKARQLLATLLVEESKIMLTLRMKIKLITLLFNMNVVYALYGHI